MTYDASFDQTRLDILAHQYLAENTAEGRVLFLSEAEDNSLEHARWKLDDAAYNTLNTAGFKLDLMELLRILMIYRAQCAQPNASQGVVYIRKNALVIEWLLKSEFDVLFDE